MNSASGESDAALVAFRAAVEGHRRDGTSLEELRDPLRQFYVHAHQERMSPERVLIRVKHALEGLLARDGDDRAEHQAVRNRIISMAITTYYSDRPV